MMPSYVRRNPYVGPRPFRQGEVFYGRDREALHLFYQLAVDRVMLFYSPSGAGKTSLIHAGLIPRLQNEGFYVLPVIRFLQELPAELFGVPVLNHYTFSVCVTINTYLPQESQMPLEELAELTLDEFLSLPVINPPGEGKHSPRRVLIIDQFEEFLTLNSADLEGKTAFMMQLGEALRDPHLWALFAMREDLIAGLDPYTRYLPGGLQTTFRLDMLGPEAATKALIGPAQSAGVEFEEAAAQSLVNDLREVLIQQSDGTLVRQLGAYIDPVQLQLVGSRLWENLRAGEEKISLDDVASLGDVSQTLASYYADQVGRIAIETGVSERKIRYWFDRQLISAQGLRQQVYMDADTTAGLENEAVRILQNAYLLRAEKRRGVTWLELTHDRLIRPIRANNVAWFEMNLAPLPRRALSWVEQGRPESLLLSGRALKEAERWAKAHPKELDPLDVEFLRASRHQPP